MSNSGLFQEIRLFRVEEVVNVVPTPPSRIETDGETTLLYETVAEGVIFTDGAVYLHSVTRPPRRKDEGCWSSEREFFASETAREALDLPRKIVFALGTKGSP